MDTDINITDYFGDHIGFGEHKKTAMKLLKRVTKMLDENNIDYFLISGTLLGYVRHNDFIPWDDDIDLIVDGEALKKLDKTKYKKLNFLVINDGITKVCYYDKIIDLSPIFAKCAKEYHRPNYHWPFVDLFSYTYDNKKKNLLFFNKIWDVNSFFPNKRKYFLKMMVSIPRDSHYFLEKNYGKDYMTTLVSTNYCHKEEKNIRDRKRITMNEYVNYIKYKEENKNNNESFQKD